jgi:hypothetical protein
MKGLLLLGLYLISFSFLGCNKEKKSTKLAAVNIIFLHHSVGKLIWDGGGNNVFMSQYGDGDIKKVLANKNYNIEELTFPKEKPYGWNNYPYDYYNIWVKNAGNNPYQEEPTLEMLTKQYNVIIWKHCFPSSDISETPDDPDINSSVKCIENYKLQYLALRDKMHEFPNVKFIVWTIPALVKNETSPFAAKKAQAFNDWVKNEWDIQGDNIYLWDFRELQTNGGLFFYDKYAKNNYDSHPNSEFSARASGLLAQRIIDVIESDGLRTDLTGSYK